MPESAIWDSGHWDLCYWDTTYGGGVTDEVTQGGVVKWKFQPYRHYAKKRTKMPLDYDFFIEFKAELKILLDYLKSKVERS